MDITKNKKQNKNKQTIPGDNREKVSEPSCIHYLASKMINSWPIWFHLYTNILFSSFIILE